MSSSEQLLGDLVRRATPVVLRTRRAVLVRRTRVLAAAAGVTVDVDVALDARIGRGVRVEVPGGGQLRVGPGAVVGDGVLLQLKGGSIDIGAWTDLRRGVVLNVAGRFAVGERCVLGAGTTVHCAHDVRIGDRVGIGEYTTIVDTSHRHTVPDRPAYDSSVLGAVRVGSDAFVATKCTLARGASVGEFAFVGACSVVLSEVPARTFVSGVPARHVHDVVVPWER